MNLETRLTNILAEVISTAKEFRAEFPDPTYDEAVDSIHERIIHTARVRSYLSGQVGSLIIITRATKIDLLNKTLAYEQDRAEALGRVKFKDFESAPIQNARVTLEVMDQFKDMKKAEIAHARATAALNFASEYLEEFQRAAQDLNLRVKVMYNNG